MHYLKWITIIMNNYKNELLDNDKLLWKYSIYIKFCFFVYSADFFTRL